MRTLALALAGVTLGMAAVLAVACGDGGANGLGGRYAAYDQPDDAGAGGGDLDGSDGINRSGNGAGTGAATGLPCDVQQLLENRCIGCHLGPSPVALLTYEDLTKPSAADPAKNNAQRSLERMQSAASPMPPKPAEAPTAAEIGVLQAWVTAGTPKGATCTPSADGGAGDGGAATNPYNTPVQCSSKTMWNKGNEGSSQMRPGGACATCHSMRGGPAYTVAGTVYPTAHEPNDCNGSPGPLTVVVTDKNGAVTNLTVNAVGNFSTRAAIAAPFTVKVTNGTKERVMAGALTAGDCNTCHTEAGVNGAPGRVMAP